MSTAGLYIMKPILIPLVFSVFIYIVINPFIDWCQQKCHMHKSIAILITVIILMMAFMGMITIMGISIKAFITGSSEYRWKLLNAVDELTTVATSYGVKIDLSLIRQSLLELPVLQMIRQHQE